MNHFAIRSIFTAVFIFISLSWASTSTAAQVNLALHKPVTASSIEAVSLSANNATDGVATSRWSSSFSDNQWITVDLGANHFISGVKLNWQNSHAVEYHIQTSLDNTTWTTVFTESKGDGGIDNISLTGNARYVRMYGLKRFTRWGFSLWEFEVYGTLNVTNVALGRTTVASSQENSALSPANAVDGLSTSRWSSSFSDNQWLMIDLGTNHQIGRVKLNWQNSYGREYQLQTSSDNVNWTTIFHEENGDGGIDDVQVAGNGRYLRMLGLKRFTRYGFSLWEIEVYGYPTGSTNPPSTSTGANSSSSSSSSSSSVGNSSSSNSNALTDTIAPTVPGAVKATGLATRIDLSWSPSSDNVGVTGYQVYRNGSKIADVSSAVNLYIDNAVTAGISYSYRIRARDAAGNWSAQSTAVSSKLVPAAQTTLQWSTPKARENGEYLELDDIGGYEIRYKKIADSVYTRVVIADSRTTSYNVSQLTGAYEFEIAAYDVNGLYSNFVSIQPR